MMGKCSKASNQTSKAACKYGSQCYRKDMWMSFIKNIWNLNNSKADFNTSWTRSTGTQMKQRKFRRTKRNLPSQIGTLHQMIFNMSHQMLRAKEENTIKATTGRFRKIAYQIRHSCFWVFLEEPKVFNKPQTRVHYIRLLPIHCLLKRIEFLKHFIRSHQKRSWSAYRR